MKSAQVVANTTAQPATTSASPGGSFTYPGSVAIFVPSGGSTVYAGGKDITAATCVSQGFPIAAGATLAVDFVGEPPYLVMPSGTQAVQVLSRY